MKFDVTDWSVEMLMESDVFLMLINEFCVGKNGIGTVKIKTILESNVMQLNFLK